MKASQIKHDDFYVELIKEQKSPEELLICAVLWRGVIDAVAERADRAVAWSDTGKVQQHTKREARYWIFSRSRGAFSFEWCLMHLFDDWQGIALKIRAKIAACEAEEVDIDRTLSLLRA